MAQATAPAFDAKPLESGSFTPPAAQPSAPAPTTTAPQAVQPEAAPAPKKKKVVKAPPPRERGVITDDPTPSFSADTARLTAEAAQRYRAIAERGGWPALPVGTRLSLGAKGPAVALLRERLMAEGDLEPGAAGKTFDKPLQDAVKRYQQRNGLARSGTVAGATLAAMNIPADVRARQLEQSALRLNDRTFGFGPRYVVVNIPSASVEAIENGTVTRRYVAVVGKPENASPTVEAKIGTVNINPTWTLPTSIIKNEIIPKMRKDPGYLARSNIRILDRSGNTVAPGSIDWNGNNAVNYTLRQDSGARNALGQIRIDMPNRDAVYMHDTPSKKYFAAQDRFYSHGCVRVQDVRSFAAWLLEGTAGVWDKPAIDAAIAIGERKDVRLAKSVPVAWVYMTGYVTDDGKVHFRDDVYSLDTGQAAQVAASKRQMRQAAREAQRITEATGSVPPGAPMPTAGPGATGQMIDPPVPENGRRGWLWW